MHKKLIYLVIALFFIVIQSASANNLAIGKLAKTNGPVDIGIVPPADFNFKTRAEIMRLRMMQVMLHPELLAKEYSPNREVFGAMEDNKPWWGTIGEGYYGPGQNSIKGLAEESRFILNPFLLVGEAVICKLDQTQLSEEDFISKKIPMFYQPSRLRWWPASGKAEVIYEVSQYKSHLETVLGYSNFTLSPNISLEAINARDLGLQYYYLPPQWASNIDIGSPMSKPMQMTQFIHCGGSCGYPGGCNNMSPRVPELDNLSFTQLPAHLSIMFWKMPPVTGKESPDIIYTITYR